MPALALLIHRVHDAFAHIINLTMHVSLAQHGVDQCGFAVVDVRDDGDVADVGPTTLRRMQTMGCG